MRRWLSTGLPAVGFVLFAVLLWRSDPKQILANMANIPPHRLLAFPLITLLIIWIRGLRWRILLQIQGIAYSQRRAAEVWTIGFFASAVTPGKLGDAVRACYVSREKGRDFGESFLSVFVDRLLDMLVILVMSIISLFLFSRVYIRVPCHWLLLAASLALLTLSLLTLRQDLVRACLRPIYGLLVPARFKEGLTLGFHSFYDSLTAYRRDWPRACCAFALTLAYWLIVFGLVRYLAWVMDLPLGFGYVALCIPLVTVAEFLPISISGLGPREAALVFFFSVLDIPAAQAMAFSLVYLIVGTYLTSAIGLLFWLRHPVRFEEWGGKKRSDSRDGIELLR